MSPLLHAPPPSPRPQNVAFWEARLKATLCENILGTFFALLLHRYCSSCHVLDARYVVGVTAASVLLWGRTCHVGKVEWIFFPTVGTAWPQINGVRKGTREKLPIPL